ncbi:hypothetical protein CDG81_12155 [Actinopolyspora erythraea]|uniref:Uncharacterized protein n=1 Tax=Actinopolyspora erythraea TaxID=414996 RepID=A0A223RSS3_9ACTN|nr:hypothetical protein CDG81_12155 [Actinopolyspora erythraea]
MTVTANGDQRNRYQVRRSYWKHRETTMPEQNVQDGTATSELRPHEVEEIDEQHPTTEIDTAPVRRSWFAEIGRWRADALK